MAKVIERLRKGTSTVQTVLYGRGADARSQTGEYTITGLTTDSAYQIRPYVIEDGTVVYGSALTFRTAPQATVAYPIPRKIDMGMPSGVQWGEWNLGAQSITDTGEYYGWGYWEGMPGGITGTNDYYYARYSNNEPFVGDSIAGSDFDIVHMTWGGGWRMATSTEFDWLFDSNNSYQDPNEDQYITINGSRVHGRKLHSKQNSSNMLFFPATGYYVGDEAISDNYSRTWSSNKETKDGITTYVYYFVAGSITRKNHDHKYIRFPIRPVWDPVLAANSGNYSFMALSSSADMRVSMKDYAGNYVSNSQTEASFTYSFTLRSGVTEYGILIGNTGSELKISNSIRREALPVGLQEVVKIVLPSGDYWEKGSGGGGSSGGDTPDTPDISDPGDDTTETPALEVRLFGMGSDGALFNNIDISKISRYFYSSSAYSAIAHIYGRNTGGIITTPSTEAQSGVNTWSGLSAIDNYAYMLMRTSGYGGWAGGYAQSGSGQFSFTTVNTPQVTSSITWNCTTDEDNVSLLSGMVCSKAVRVPASGVSSYTGIMRFPYEFSSELFFTEVKMFPVTVDSTTHEASYPSDGVSQYTANGITVSLADGDTTLDSVLTYNISRNTTSQYREYMFIICPIQHYTTSTTPRTDWGVTLHFIQEPYNKNRIYYGTGFGAESTYRSYSDEYRNRNSAAEGELYKHHAFFQTANSRILVGSTTMHVRANSYIAYPNVFDYAIDLTGVGSTVLSAAYMWGEQEYTVVKITSDGNIQFN